MVGLGKCKVGGAGSRSNHAPLILCSAVKTISMLPADSGAKTGYTVCTPHVGWHHFAEIIL